MTRFALVVLGMLALGGCERPATAVVVPPAPAAGRYQMISSDAGVYVLDTQQGSLSKCETALTSETWCTKATDTMHGAGPPAWIADAARREREAPPSPSTEGSALVAPK